MKPLHLNPDGVLLSDPGDDASASAIRAALLHDQPATLFAVPAVRVPPCAPGGAADFAAGAAACALWLVVVVVVFA